MQFNQEALLAAFDSIAHAAIAAGKKLEIAVFGGSALMLAGNFRFTAEDVDFAALELPWPKWLSGAVTEIARKNLWSPDWLNDAVAFHLSTGANLENDHLLYGTFPRSGESAGLIVHVPTAEYMLALKLKAIRINDPAKGASETAGILNLLKILDISTIDPAMAVLQRFFPRPRNRAAC